MENIREIRQQEAVNAFLNTRDFRGITLVAPRVGIDIHNLLPAIIEIL
jgi:hypothetical protein